MLRDLCFWCVADSLKHFIRLCIRFFLRMETLFMQIRYSDESWTGQTPDIAWGKFQKKMGFSNLKVWHGKRFTCKMNGMEVHLGFFLSPQ